MRTEAEKSWFKNNPHEWERSKNFLAEELLDMNTESDYLTLVNNDRQFKCLECGLPKLAEVRGIPADMLKEIVREWKNFKEKQNADL